MTATTMLNRLGAVAFGLALILAIGLLFHAPVALAVLTWIVFIIAAAVLITQLVRSQQPPVQRPARTMVVRHDDGSIEVVEL